MLIKARITQLCCTQIVMYTFFGFDCGESETYVIKLACVRRLVNRISQEQNVGWMPYVPYVAHTEYCRRTLLFVVLAA